MPSKHTQPLEQDQTPTPESAPQNTQESAPETPTTLESTAPENTQAQDTTQDSSSSVSQDTQPDTTTATLAQTPPPEQNPSDSSDSDTPTTSPERPSLPDLDTTAPTLPDTSKLDAFQEQLQAAIEQNPGVIANTHYTLQGIAALLEISKDLWRFYQYHSESLQLSNEQITTLKESLQAISTYINNTLETIANAHTAAQTLFNTTEALLDEAKSEALKINADLQAIKDALKKIQELELSLQKIVELNAQLKANLALAQAMKDEINALVPNILNELKANLLADKEQYEQELEAKKDEYAALLDEKLSGLDEKIESFEQDYTTKEQAMNDALKALEEFIATLEARKVEFRTEFETYLRDLQAAHDTHVQSLQGAHDTHAQALQDFKDQKQNELESFKAQKQAQLQDFKEQKTTQLTEHTTTQLGRIESSSQNCQNEIRVFSEDFLREVNAFNSAAILELRELYYAIATNTQQLGNGYQSKSFTTSGTFTLVPGVRDYFVFVRGGTGGSHNGTAGGISSFGSYASANGGAGNSGGAGQRGESKAQFVYIQDESVASVQVAVASGGVVIVSWAKDLEAKVDTSFLNAEDLEILSKSRDTQAQQTWIAQNITNKKQENYYRQLVGLEVITAPITQDNLARILDKKGAQAFSKLRALELELARAYLDTGKAISAQITELIAGVASYTIALSPEITSLEVGASQVLKITTQASDFTSECSNEHIAFEKESKTLSAKSAGEGDLLLSVVDDLKQEQITKSLHIVVTKPTPPEPPKEPEGGDTSGGGENSGGDTAVEATPDSPEGQSDFTPEDLAVLYLDRAYYERAKGELRAGVPQESQEQALQELYTEVKATIESEKLKSVMTNFRAYDEQELITTYTKLLEASNQLYGSSQAEIFGFSPKSKGDFVYAMIFNNSPGRSTLLERLGSLESYVALQAQGYTRTHNAINDLSPQALERTLEAHPWAMGLQEKNLEPEALHEALSFISAQHYIQAAVPKISPRSDTGQQYMPTYDNFLAWLIFIASTDYPTQQLVGREFLGMLLQLKLPELSKLQAQGGLAYLVGALTNAWVATHGSIKISMEASLSLVQIADDESANKLIEQILSAIDKATALESTPPPTEPEGDTSEGSQDNEEQTPPSPIEICAKQVIAQSQATKDLWQAQAGRGFDALLSFLGEHHDYSSMGNGQKDEKKLAQALRAYRAMLLQAGISDDSGANALVEEIVRGLEA